MDTHRQPSGNGASQPPQLPPGSPGVQLPTPSMQNQMHELAKTLPPPRKQNTACDACRSRKVKCHRLPGQEKCQHCLSKNYPCTHYVQQATSEKKRTSAPQRRRQSSGGAASAAATAAARGDRPSMPHASGSGSTQLYASTSSDHSTSSTSPPPSQYTTSPTQLRPSYGYPGQLPYQSQLPYATQQSAQLPYISFFPPVTLATPPRALLAWLFSPPPSSRAAGSGSGGAYDAWGAEAWKLEDEKFRADFALDLVEVFFQIVHTRWPLLNPSQFRARLDLGATPATPTSPTTSALSQGPPPHPALVATVLAWGTKFSEHPLLTADRARPGARGASALARTMVERTRELAEALKVHRIPSVDHVVISMLIEPLQNQNPDDSEGFHGFWITAATRHLIDMQVNHKSVMSNIQDPEARGTMIFAWWMVCISDAYGSVYYRHKPLLDDDDYDIDFYTADPTPSDGLDQSGKPSPREQLEFLGYYRAAHALARIARQISHALWRPATDADGIPLNILFTFRSHLVEWRETYLAQVGVPSNFEAEWDFISAISACASDATYHLMWIVVFNAMDDFGVRDQASLSGDQHLRMIEIMRKVADEAVHGALRIAGLAGVLASNGYLRLDPAVMNVSCIQAGTLLARLGRPEVSNCIAGLDQYSSAYEEACDQVDEMKRLYAAARAGDFDFQNMASVAPVVTPPSADDMKVD